MGKTTTMTLFQIARDAARTARLMVGMPDYQTYVAHRRKAHPDEPVMSYQDFFRERQASRYGEGSGKINRCC